jgi:hypothetical protein
MKSALSDALSAKNRPPPGGGLFGPDALMRLAMDSRTRHLMDDKVGGKGALVLITTCGLVCVLCEV